MFYRAISYEYSNVYDSYFIHRYIIIKNRSSSITGKIHQLLSELQAKVKLAQEKVWLDELTVHDLT